MIRPEIDSIFSKPSPDSVMAAGRLRGAPRVMRLIPFLSLVWLGWIFGPAIFNIGVEFGRWLWPTLASLPVFLFLYWRGYSCPRRHNLWYGRHRGAGRRGYPLQSVRGNVSDLRLRGGGVLRFDAAVGRTDAGDAAVVFAGMAVAGIPVAVSRECRADGPDCRHHGLVPERRAAAAGRIAPEPRGSTPPRRQRRA